MSTPYDTAIEALKAKRKDLVEQIDSALLTLERLQREYREGSGAVGISAPTAHGTEPTNEEAMGRIMEVAFPEWIGVPEIVERGPTVGGRDLNKNSVRWVLKHWHDDDKITKKKDGRRVRYRLNK